MRIDSTHTTKFIPAILMIVEISDRVREIARRVCSHCSIANVSDGSETLTTHGPFIQVQGLGFPMKLPEECVSERIKDRIDRCGKQSN
jgi:hypothetical protein